MQEQQSSQQAEPDFAAFVAIDWADQKHYFCMSAAGDTQCTSGELDNTPEAVEVWVAGLIQQFGHRPIAVALEQSRGALVTMLSKYEQLHLYPIHPTAMSSYRDAFNPSGRKNDPVDAQLQHEMLTKHRDRLRRLAPDTTAMRLLAGLTEARRNLVNEKTAVSNRLTDKLKICFPQLLKWFGEASSPLVGDLVSQYPTLMELKKAKPAALKKFFVEHNCRDEETIQKHIDNIAQAIPATKDEAILGAAKHVVAVCVGQLRLMREAVKELDKRIAELAHQQKDWEIFESLPGAGKALAPRLMAAMGSKRDRFASANELQCFSGIAPVSKSSGKSKQVLFRRACPKFTRQGFHEWAEHSLRHCAWANLHYQQHRENGEDHHTAVRAVAFKWERIVFRCWQDGTPYREEVHLANLAKKNPEFYRKLQPVTSCGKALSPGKAPVEKTKKKT